MEDTLELKKINDYNNCSRNSIKNNHIKSFGFQGYQRYLRTHIMANIYLMFKYDVKVVLKPT